MKIMSFCFDLSIYLNSENPSFEFYVNRVTAFVTAIFKEDSSEFFPACTESKHRKDLARYMPGYGTFLAHN